MLSLFFHLRLGCHSEYLSVRTCSFANCSLIFVLIKMVFISPSVPYHTRGFKSFFMKAKASILKFAESLLLTSVCLFVGNCSSTCLSVCLPLFCSSTCLSLCLFVCPLFLRPPVCPFVCLLKLFVLL